MVLIPEFLIDHRGLNIYERALIPIIIRYTVQWGNSSKGVSLDRIAAAVELDFKQTLSVLDLLIEKGIVERRQTQEEGQRIILFVLSRRVIEQQHIPVTEKSLSLPDTTNDPWYFLNMPNVQYAELKAYAMTLLTQLVLPETVFVDFELYQRSQNRKSHDWHAEFQRWALREQRKQEQNRHVASYDESFKPTPEQFQLTQYFIAKLQAIDPQFQEPTDWSWAQQMKLLVEEEGYGAEEIKKAIDWLFSAKGDWYRPNVPDVVSLRKKFTYIISHVRSYRSTKQQVPVDVDIFDMYEKDLNSNN